MKTALNKIAIVVFFLAAVFGCQKDEPIVKDDDPIAEIPSPTTTQSTISGKIVVPIESGIDVNNLTISSPIDVATVSDGTYEMVTQEDKFLTQLVSDNNGEVLLMGFTYPGQTDFEINTKSTALAMLMNLPFSLLMSDEAKQELIAKFLGDPGLKNIEDSIEKQLKNNTSPLDISSPELATTVSVFYNQLLFPQASKSSKLDYSYDPVDIRLTNNEITFVNLGKTYDTEIGIYKDEVKIKSITSERITFLPTTIGQAMGAFASAYGGTPLPGDLQPAEYTYTFENDGQYDIRIRTGKSTDTSIENQVALLSNYINWGSDIILEVLPLGDCIQPMIANFKQHVQTFGGFEDATTQQEKLGLLHDVLYTFFNESTTLAACFTSAEQVEDYLKQFASLLKFIDLVGKIGNGGNILVGIAQLVVDEGEMDLCYSVEETQVSECDKGDVYIAGWSLNENDLPVAMVWKNGSVTNLASGSGLANKIYVTNDDVYVAGQQNGVATIWKNGIATTLTSDISMAHSIYVEGADVYATGYVYDDTTGFMPVLWKNGVTTTLSESIGFVNAQVLGRDVFVSGADVYVTGSILGNEQFDATVWKNSATISLTVGNSFANSVYVSGNDVYVAGMEQKTSDGPTTAKIWKNGEATSLTDGNTMANANSVYVIDNDVHIAGEVRNGNNIWVATTWKNGIASSITGGSTNAFAKSIYVYNNVVYVVGNENYVATFWKDGVSIPLSSGRSDANSIFIKEPQNN
ncbi:Putative lipoprotein [Croceitalea dokdonensis DOKDO 023]|uniref:Putative lipoprotein n=1 Tax=Croceitalea dokdonensis DOKDO 023 TaxID=1300341 RepID=A0A0P7A7L1_9FLAO|nr:hypothetical protein [Croceitalea dokdonensis]KPM32786.1 Putative lipoprotein [Croceitalea dokdonensis DOKDO 023]